MRVIVFCALTFFFATVLAIEPVKFTDVTVTGTFVETAISGSSIPKCDYCSCTVDKLGCSWETDKSCTYDHQKLFDESQIRWGSSSSYYCFPNSGLGFEGVSGLTITANAEESTKIGTIRHYNNIINDGSPTRVRLSFSLTASTLTNKFWIAYPMRFLETPNLDPDNPSDCDPSLQKSNVGCDDHLSFTDENLSDHFQQGVVMYTLSVTGFIQTGSTPISGFFTEEKHVNSASLMARIITYCVESACGPNQLYVTVPECGCVCQIQNSSCQIAFGPDWYVGDLEDGKMGCTCLCGRDPDSCNSTDGRHELNPDSCTCGCNLTDGDCQKINSLWGVSAGGCNCTCNRQKQLECSAVNPYYVAAGEDCHCECTLSDEICGELFGDDYSSYDADECACVAPPEPSSPTLTDGEIAGIVVAVVVGSTIITLILAALLAVLIWLIQAGIIPGIYGYKIASADIASGSVNPGFESPWSDASSALG